MAKIFVLYWAKGSCGDIMQTLVCHPRGLYNGFEHEIDSQGRAWRRISPEFAQLFPHNQPHLFNTTEHDHGWLGRTWSVEDCDQLVALSQRQPVIVGTHDRDQVRFLKQCLGNDITTVGVCYESWLQKFVVKNYCVKMLSHDQLTAQCLEHSDPQLSKLLTQHNAQGLWALKNHLKFEPIAPDSVAAEFDVNIDLAEFLTGNLQWIADFLPQQHMYDHWLSLQNPLFLHSIPANKHYDQCLGRNIRASISPKQPIVLDLYDKIFINFYCKQHQLPNPSAVNHLELIEFFENQAAQITTTQESTAQ